MTDSEIITAFRAGNREKPIRFLYKEYPKIERLIVQSGCSKTLARELFNDSLLILIEKVQSPEFELSSKLSTYLYGINRFLVKNELRKQNRRMEVEWSDTLVVTASDLEYDAEKEEKLKVVEQLLEKVSEKCKAIFKLFYFEKRSMDFIAKKLEYTSVNSAKTQKYKCVERAYKLAQKEQLFTVNND